MRRLWSPHQLVERWSLKPQDFTLLVGRIDAGELGLAQLAHWRCHVGFPDEEADIAPTVIAHLACQVGVPIDALDGYNWSGRTGRRHRQAILDYLAIAAFDDEGWRRVSICGLVTAERWSMGGSSRRAEAS